MLWIAKDPPIYVWDEDAWYNEKDQVIYIADVRKLIWHHFHSDWDQFPKIIPFPQLTKIMD